MNDAATEVSHWPDQKGSEFSENAGANQKIQVDEKGIALSENAGANQKMLEVERALHQVRMLELVKRYRC